MDRLSAFGLGVLVGVTTCALVVAGVWLVRTIGDDGPAGASQALPGATRGASAAGAGSPGASRAESSHGNAPQPRTGAGSPAPGMLTGQGRLPNGDLVQCPAPTQVVSTAAQLTAALAAARPGTSISMADGTYAGHFAAAATGTSKQPIWLCGGPGAVLDGGGTDLGYVLHLQRVSFWRVVGFTVRNGQKGVVADATTDTVIQGLTVHSIGDEGIHLRAASTGNAVIGNTVHSTGLHRAKFGEGIYVGSARSNWGRYGAGGPDRSDRNLLKGNTISNTGAEAIDMKEGTTGGAAIGNTFDGQGMTGADSWVDVKGNEWIIEDNTGRNSPRDGFQTHQIVAGWGTGNMFQRNVVEGDLPGLGINLTPVLGNVVTCDNTTATGSAVTTNTSCSG